MRARFGVSVAGPLALVLAGCTGGSQVPKPGPVPRASAGAPSFPVETANNPSAIAPADTIAVLVYREPEVSLSSVIVAPDGTINMLLVGPVQVAGLTPAEVAQGVTERLRKFLVDPRVSVNIVASPARSVTIEGAVQQPGVIPYVPNLSLLGAIAQARGTVRVAKTDSVTVIRRVGTERYLAVFDLAPIRAGASADLMLQPGDTVIIGVSGRRQTWQDFLQAAPLIGLFTRF